MFKALMVAAALVAAGWAQADTSPAKKELVAKVLKLQQPALEVMARQMAEQPAVQLMQQAGPALQRLPEDRREAVARDIDADVNGLDNVYLKNIDDLTAVVSEEASGRKAEVERAERIVAEEAARFLAWFRTREAVPVITQLRERLDTIRQEELNLLRSQLGSLSDREWLKIEAAFRSMATKFAREPIRSLKRATSDHGADPGSTASHYDLLSAAREIFGLEEAATHPRNEPEALPTLPAVSAPSRREDLAVLQEADV